MVKNKRLTDSEINACCYIFGIPYHVPTEKEVQERIKRKTAEMFPAEKLEALQAEIDAKIKKAFSGI